MRPKVRLDQLLVERGFVESRTRAQSLIIQGYFQVDGRTVTKPGTRVRPDADIRWTRTPQTVISRGEYKLHHALDVFAIDPTGKTAVDIGASTGGFTHCLLTRGARKVYAVDVGRGQLDVRLRQDPRVVVMERTNARYLTRTHIPEPVHIVTMDVSFISATKILPAVTRLDFHGDCLVLVKPQFELEPKYVGRGGIVRRPEWWIEAVLRVARAAVELGFSIHGWTPSPIRGSKGNREFFLHLRYPADPGGWTIRQLTDVLTCTIGPEGIKCFKE